jgi:hypothetical protein
MSFRKVWRSAWIVVAIGVAACGDDSLGPADFEDAAALNENMSSADSAFDSEAYASFAAVSADLASTTAAPAAPFLQSTMATLPHRTSLYTTSALRADRLRQLTPALRAAATTGPVIDDALYGNVYRWDETTGEYFWDGVEQVSGLNGVRFILYRVDDFGTIDVPLVEVGYVDLVDESVSGSTRLRTVVAGVGGTAPTYVNYLATANVTATTLSITATGFITNALPAAANKTLTFDVSIGANQTTATFTLDATFQLNDPDITLDLEESVRFTEEAIIVSVDFQFIRPSEVVRLLGDFSFGETQTVDMEVRAGGGVVARIQGDPATAQWVDAGGAPLDLDDLDALDRLIIIVLAFEEAIGSIIGPIEEMSQPAA